MSYTVLRVIDAGVVLYSGHERRFARAGSEALTAFQEFASNAAPGIYALTWNGRLDVQQRAASSQFDGIPTRFVPSPLTQSLHKSAPPNPYTAVRAPGIATLLTSPDGSEIYESCSASTIAWDGRDVIAPPDDRPRLLSTAMEALAGSIKHAPLLTDSDEPLALVNAVAGVVLPDVPGRRPFPPELRDRLLSALFATARR